MNRYENYKMTNAFWHLDLLKFTEIKDLAQSCTDVLLIPFVLLQAGRGFKSRIPLFSDTRTC